VRLTASAPASQSKRDGGRAVLTTRAMDDEALARELLRVADACPSRAEVKR
jgi:hypothetical protein